MKRHIIGFLLLALSLMIGQAQPYYRVKFVDLHHRQVAKNHEITDARRDLGLLGYTYARMIDVIPATPLAIVTGRPVGKWEMHNDDTNLAYWPYRFLSPNTAIAQFGGYPTYDAKARFLHVRASRGSWRKIAEKPSMPSSSPHAKGFLSGDHSVPNWALPWIRQASTGGYEPHCDLVGYLTQSAKLINVTYYPITPGYDTCMHDAEDQMAFVQVGRKIMPLKDVVQGGKDYVFGEFVWVSPDGWFVVRGSHRGHDGFAWLYPIH